MIRTKVLLGLLAGFTVGTILGALFSIKERESPADKKGKGEKPDEAGDDVVIKY